MGTGWDHPIPAAGGTSQAQGCAGSRVRLCFQLLLCRANGSHLPFLPPEMCFAALERTRPHPSSKGWVSGALPSSSCRLFTFASRRWLWAAACLCSSWCCRLISGSQGEEKGTIGGTGRSSPSWEPGPFGRGGAPARWHLRISPAGCKWPCPLSVSRRGGGSPAREPLSFCAERGRAKTSPEFCMWRRPQTSG